METNPGVKYSLNIFDEQQAWSSLLSYMAFFLCQTSSQLVDIFYLIPWQQVSFPSNHRSFINSKEYESEVYIWAVLGSSQSVIFNKSKNY